jgi:hypothetical protein
MEGFRLSNQLTLHGAPLTRPALLQRRLTDGATAPGGTKHFHGHSPELQGFTIFTEIEKRPVFFTFGEFLLLAPV